MTRREHDHDPPRLRSAEGPAPEEVRATLESARAEEPSATHLEELRGRLRSRIKGASPSPGGGTPLGRLAPSTLRLGTVGLAAAAVLGAVLWTALSSRNTGESSRPAERAGSDALTGSEPAISPAPARPEGSLDSPRANGREALPASDAGAGPPDGPANGSASRQATEREATERDRRAQPPSERSVESRARRAEAGGDERSSPLREARPRGPRTAGEREARSRETELTLVRRAQDALHEGRPADALEAAGAHRDAYPAGMLAQERDVITVHALVELGRLDEARRRAGELRRRYPDSAHRKRVERLVERYAEPR